jgi:hypothetical protein
MALCVVLMITGCGSDESAPANKEEVLKEEDKSKKEKVKTVDKKADAPKDQGDYKVWFKGDVERKDKLITVKGKTNLLPESRLMIGMDSVEGTIIGGNESLQVNEDGTFNTELEIPNEYEGLIEVSIKFEPSTDNQPIRDHYGENGEKLEGSFVRINEDSGVKQTIAFVTLEVPQDESKAAITIEEPKWNKPEDYGSTTVRIDDPDIQKDERYIYIEGKTNLLEGTRLRGRLDIPDFITSGFQDVVDVHPDGSYRMIIEKPQTNNKLKEVKDYELVISMSPLDSTWQSIKDAYGENGEKLQGKLVIDESNSKSAEKKISIVE